MTARPQTPFGAALAQQLSPGSEIADDPATLAAYASDASNHRVLPAAVLRPRAVDEIAAAVAWCRSEGVPLTSRGAGTNIAGAAIGPGLVLDYSRHFNKIEGVDAESRTAVVQPGVVLDALQRQAAPIGLRFGPDPSTHNRCTIGGMIGTNACGSHSVAWGTTADCVRDLEVLRADGSIVRLSAPPTDLRTAAHGLAGAYIGEIRSGLGRFPRQVSGYGLQHLLPEHGPDLVKAFVGSEGTLGIVTSATLDLAVLPQAEATVLAAFPDVIAAAVAAPLIAAAGPLTVEAISEGIVEAFDSRRTPEGRPELPPGRAWLLVDVGADHDGLPDEMARVAAVCRDAGATSVQQITDPRIRRANWSIRERGAGLGTRTADGREAWAGWEDAAVPPEQLADYLRDFQALMAEHGRTGVLYGHFGEGCVHVRIDHDLVSEAGRRDYRRFLEAACDLVIEHDGVPSGEHGDGRARSELLPRVYGDQLTAAFAEYKSLWDPDNLFNPGILVDPAKIDDDLRQALSRPHTRPQLPLAFSYPDDQGDWGQAMRRCVGVGACRKTSGGGMCPSYRATQEEVQSTRGRARVLFEMLDGNLADQGWASEDVKDALDLCLSCKACASECPVGVDMATYKAEFLYQHYRGKRRPLSHYTMGRLPTWLKLARRAPRMANAALRIATFPGVAKLAGINPERPLPKLATRSRARATVVEGEARARLDTTTVTLWLDSFTTAFTPEAVDDAITVLQAAGFAVQPVGLDECCGLTLISTGQLDEAKKTLTRSIELLSRTQGDIVVLEPSCAAAFKHDAPPLLDTQAAREVGARVRTLAEVVVQSDLQFHADRVGEVVSQFHCHQRAVLGTTADKALLARLGVPLTSVDEGCCGLAGNFGYEPGHHEVSVACAEQALLPALRAQPDAEVLADGFSCRLQIEQLGGRNAVHLATLLARCLKS